eukprot:Nitzschia sp. Nitz4//scaffold50_size126154//39864//44429//NITZ4_003679-RA/size126154-processed-gene-0.35-mRNA-1//1//CDS//3329553680//258//frame0
MEESHDDDTLPTSGNDRDAARSLRKKKQMMFQRHKALISASPRHADSTVNETKGFHVDPIDTSVDESTAPQNSGTSDRKSALSSPYIRAKLAAKNGNLKEELLNQVPRRHQVTTITPKSVSRKTDLIKQIKSRKIVVAASPKNLVAEMPPREKEDDEVTDITSNLQVKAPTKKVGFSEAHDEEEEPGKLSLPNETDVPVDESTSDKLDTVADRPKTPTDMEIAEQLQAYLEEGKQYADPPLDMLSEASAAQSAFDMRSIHQHPPSPPPREEPPNSSDNHISGDDDNELDFTPIDDGFARRLMGIDRNEEEKKETTVNESEPEAMDASWDVSTPVFSQNPVPTEEQPANQINAFDTTSWGNADVTFSAEESQFFRQSEEATNEGTAQQPEQQLVEDFEGNVPLAANVDSVGVLVDTSPGATDEEPLLESGSQDAEDVVAPVDPPTSMDDRVSSYNKPNQQDEESSVENGSDSDNNSADDNADVDYVGQNSDDEDEEFGDTQTNDDFGMKNAMDVEASLDIVAQVSNAPFKYVPGALELSVDEELGEVKVEAPSVLQLTGAPPPPPPPPPEEKKKKRQSKEYADSNKVPLLAPPPEEKLKKWEEEKTRGQRHLAELEARKKEHAQAAQIPLEPQVDTDANAEQESELFEGVTVTPARDDKQQEFASFGDTSLLGPPDVTREVKHSLFQSSTKPRDVRSPSEKARSPSNIETVFGGGRLAEKVALASSTAAVSFEKNLGSETPTRVSVGAFANWLDSGEKISSVESKKDASNELATSHPGHLQDQRDLNDDELLTWLTVEVLRKDIEEDSSNETIVDQLRQILENKMNFNQLCQHVSEQVNQSSKEIGMTSSFEELATTASIGTTEGSIEVKAIDHLEKKRPWLKPMVLSSESDNLEPRLLAANFVSFLNMASRLSNVPSPFEDSNPFLSEIVNSPDDTTSKTSPSPQQMIFDSPQGEVTIVLNFFYRVCECSHLQSKVSSEGLSVEIPPTSPVSSPLAPGLMTPNAGNVNKNRGRRFIVPDTSPSPFETAIWEAPRIVLALLSFLGDPVAVCRVKAVNRYCRRIVSENEQVIMQNAVRAGGLSMNMRPAFWMWITLQKGPEAKIPENIIRKTAAELIELDKGAHSGKWHSAIESDVGRAFGKMPPHRTGSRLKADSIVKALVTWGKNRIMRRGVKGGGEDIPLPDFFGGDRKQKGKSRPTFASSPPWECAADTTSVVSEESETPTDTVSDWGGVSPVVSYIENTNSGLAEGEGEGEGDSIVDGREGSMREDIALSGSYLNDEIKKSLQEKLSFILHCLAEAHEEVGYCQGMDYIAAHLLRVLQETIRWKAVQGTLPDCIDAVVAIPNAPTFEEVDGSIVVEETVFKVMHSFFSTNKLQQMYSQELRSLKMCCKVFERLVHIKLPTLADHFEHHELDIGLFALGWFQTLFLYLPSMPSATVCHMWDIWLVERSLKIFFRVGTAILFLSQPILLNYELEGMMIWLNTMPDATLLRPDILIPCALNIKVTNQMLQELEDEIQSVEI